MKAILVIASLTALGMCLLFPLAMADSGPDELPGTVMVNGIPMTDTSPNGDEAPIDLGARTTSSENAHSVRGWGLIGTIMGLVILAVLMLRMNLDIRRT